jgi:hypothetical protein
MVLTQHHYTSVATSFDMSGLDKISKHANKAYYENPVEYITAVWGAAGIPGFKPDQVTEQDGLMNRDTQLNGWWSMFPRCPRSFHAGFTGYNRKIEGVDAGGSDNSLTFFEKYEELAFLEKNPQQMVERAAAYCAGCKDVTPISLEGFFADRLIYCAEVEQDPASTLLCLDANWPPPVSEVELAVAQQTAMPPPMQCTAVQLADKSFEGKGIRAHDLPITPATTESSKECCGRCAATEKCGGWTWIRNDHKCYLKTIEATTKAFVDDTKAISSIRGGGACGGAVNLSTHYPPACPALVCAWGVHFICPLM